MKAVMASIRPKHTADIKSGKKTLEIRKSIPKIPTPFKCYIYETMGPVEVPWVDEDGHHIYKGCGKVIGEFVCDQIKCYVWSAYERPFDDTGEYNISVEDLKNACLTYSQFDDYGGGYELYGWHISQLKIYDKPKPLSNFYKECAGLDNTGLCDDCENAVGEECDCAVNGRLHLTRPPQSWCYVEDKK